GIRAGPAGVTVSLAQPRAERRRRASWALFAYLRPQEPVPRRVYLGTVTGSAVGLVALWCLLSYGGVVEPLFLPSPTAILAAGIDLTGDGTLVQDMRASLAVIVTGWALAAVLAVPIGILTGSSKAADALVEPVVLFVRYPPARAIM